LTIAGQSNWLIFRENSWNFKEAQLPLDLTWEQIALRIALASLASFIIGFNRDEHGHPAGIRTTMLVCLAATLAMLQVNLLLPLAGKLPSSFVVMDLMRLPLGILSGIGFIGAGVIIKHKGSVSGVTTAATIWLVTILGLLFGGGNLYLGIAGSLVTFVILWALKLIEKYLPREHHGSLRLSLSPEGISEVDLRHLLEDKVAIVHWNPSYAPATTLAAIECEVKWVDRASRSPQTPQAIDRLRNLPGVVTFSWKE
jgi:putative Mg2+ transporter-C (MgtC) family protein